MTIEQLVCDAAGRADGLDALRSENRPEEVLAAVNEQMLDAYWKQKDIRAVVALARLGLALGLEATGGSEPELAAKLKGTTKAISYNLASFCWPGWDEPGIAIRAEDVMLGEEAAELNLRLAVELDRGPGPLANAHWMLAAYRLWNRRYPEAERGFARAEKFAIQAGEPASPVLNRGFQALARALSGDVASWTEFDENLSLLCSGRLQHGDNFAGQLQTARRVLESRPESSGALEPAIG